MIDNILIVCSGNICRSPMAKSISQLLMPHKTIDSAGLFVNQCGLDKQPAASHAQTVVESRHASLAQHCAKQLSHELVQRSDLILVMTHEHMEQIANVVAGARSKTMLIGQWIGIGDIPDPIGLDLSTFEECYLVLEKALKSWHLRLD